MSPEPVTEALESIRGRTALNPTVAVILGSGLGEFADSIRQPVVIHTSEIPGYPRSTVVGHKGALVFGSIGQTSVVAFQGRVHLYESGDPETACFPVRIGYGLGARTLVVTNAAGGINRSFGPGDLMLITDHLNMTAKRGAGSDVQAPERGPFYDADLLAYAESQALQQGLVVRKGVYAGVRGPSYETAAEVEMLHRFGADAVGMSTVMEVELARRLGMRVLGISCITNKATGVSLQKLDHSEVTIVANRVKKDFAQFLNSVISSL